MTLTLYNTLTRKKEAFTPIDPGNVRMYVCGPTVYDFAHIGNARPVIVFDVLFRLLRHRYGVDQVTYARNITDVDDKINARALRDFPGLPLNDAIARVTSKTTDQFHADVKALGCLEPTVEPRATDNIPQMIGIIVTLLARGHAYVAASEVLFDTKSMPDYGELSKRNLDEQQAGARIEVEAHKKNPGDFVLWKLSSVDEPGWDSPWGRGRPGWHIECSAMSARYLGHVFDIHGGGLDLIFPHHENEIAQSRCAHGTPVMANTWMHNGFLQVEGEKMSKSLGNFITINELLATDKFGGRRWPGEVLRYAMLMTSYREPINWTVDRLTEAHNELSAFADAVISGVEHPYPVESETAKPDQRVLEALYDDLNTPLARKRLHVLRKVAESGDQASIWSLIATLRLLGLYRPAYHAAYDAFSFSGRNVRIDLLNKYRSGFHDAHAIVLNEYDLDTKDAAVREASRRAVENRINSIFPEMQVDDVAFELSEHCQVELVPRNKNAEQPSEKIEVLIAARLAARKAKDFKEGDRIRDELAGMGITLKDTKNKDTGEIETTWEAAR